MSILFYKQRHRNPNFKDTAGANYAHIRYIATRPRVMKNEAGSHGLFGKLEPGTLTEFEDWKEVAKKVYANSKKGIVMYRSVVSFTEETAKELLLKDQKSWQRYVENHIMTIAEKNGIKREHLQWAASVHGEKSHPHVHIVFWDNTVCAKNPFTSPKIPDAIRKQMIKDTFSEKILAFAKQKDEAIKNMRQITNELVAEFENDLRCRNPGRYKMAGKVLEDELEMGISFDTKVLEQLTDKLFALRDLIPEQGRIAYQLLPQDCKEMTDQLVEFLLSEVPEIRKCFDCYVDAKYKLSELYATDNKWLKSQKEKYGKEAKKILANRILSGVKTICRLEKEENGAAYLAKHRDYLASRIIMEAISYYQSHSGMISGTSQEKYISAIGNYKTGQVWEAAAEQYGGVSFVFPYVAELERQYDEAVLFEKLGTKDAVAFQTEIKKLIAEVFGLHESVPVKAKSGGAGKKKLTVRSPFVWNKGEF